jgi:hypothetical protein
MIQFGREEPGLPGSVTLDGCAGESRFVWESETMPGNGLGRSDPDRCREILFALVNRGSAVFERGENGILQASTVECSFLRVP